jgi:hypothetical protein
MSHSLLIKSEKLSTISYMTTLILQLWLTWKDSRQKQAFREYITIQMSKYKYQSYI